MENIKKLPKDVRDYLEDFIFFRCKYCNKKFLLEEIEHCDYCNNVYCLKHKLIIDTCFECFDKKMGGYLEVAEEFINSCIIS